MANLKLYNTTYGHAGEVHSMKPQYEVRGNAIYRTAYHPEGRSALPDFKIKENNNVYATAYHSAGAQAVPWFQIRGNNIHTTVHNPAGHQPLPVFKMK